jgi:hypothetical protein
MPEALVCYISGHGFGHAVRVLEVLRAFRRRRPECALHIRTTVPRWFIESGLGGAFTHTAVRLDVGAVQRDSLSLDPQATLHAYAALTAHTRELIAAEVGALAPLRPALVFADIPALAFDIARQLDVPSVAMTNFSWDWIYADYVGDLPAYQPLVDELRRSYAQATTLLRLPFHGDLSAFPHIRDIPLVARRAVLSGGETRRRLDLPRRDRLVLLSFGGIGIALTQVPAAPPGVTYVATQSAADGATVPGTCRFIANADLTARGVRYEDLVAAADAVITKPGYGIVADCIANGTAMIYTPRGRFAEYDHLVRGIATHLPHAFISNDDLYAGRWSAALDAVLAQPRRRTEIDVSGATVAAEALDAHAAR